MLTIDPTHHHYHHRQKIRNVSNTATTSILICSNLVDKYEKPQKLQLR